MIPFVCSYIHLISILQILTKAGEAVSNSNMHLTPSVPWLTYGTHFIVSLKMLAHKSKIVLQTAYEYVRK